VPTKRIGDLPVGVTPGDSDALPRDNSSMTLAEFEAALSGDTPPKVSPLLVAWWRDARGDWDRAHTIAQDIEGEPAALVHAFLHRKEDDLGNAAYWYRRAR
jgi:hypothetical protein